MRLLAVSARDIRALLSSPLGEYDLGIFACGFETRSAALAKELTLSKFKKLAVFAFAEYRDTPSRSSSSAYYDDNPAMQKYSLKAGDDVGVYEALGGLMASFSPDKPLRILVDYSSMSRVWYGAILNYFRHSPRLGRVELNLCYLAGIYQGQVRSNHVEAITSVPGFEGIAAGTGKSCAFFALGFDPWCAYAVHERIEPDEVWAILAERPDVPEYLDRAKRLNEDFLKNYVRDRVLIHATFDLERVFGSLCELVSRELAKSPDVTLVGLGPKPHILAMMLTAIRFPEVTLVQARGRRVEPIDVITEGKGVSALVDFVPDPQPDKH